MVKMYFEFIMKQLLLVQPLSEQNLLLNHSL